MSTLYITQQDATLRKTDERLRVTVKKDVLLDVPMIKVSQVVLYGRVNVTAATVAALMERHIEICYLTQYGQYIGRLQPKFSKNSLLRREQYQAAFDPDRSLQLARGFVLGKLLNMRTWLMRVNRKQERPEIEDVVKRIKRACDSANQASNIDQLRGHEGEGSAAYFSVFNYLLKPRSPLEGGQGGVIPLEKPVLSEVEGGQGGVIPLEGGISAVDVRENISPPLVGGVRGGGTEQSDISGHCDTLSPPPNLPHQGGGKHKSTALEGGVGGCSSFFTFEKRVRRPPTDPVNSLLSFGYTLLANDMFSAVNVVGFDPYIGYLHAERYGRASLPLDLIEEFRPVIVDSVVVSAINKEELTQNDFREEMGGVFRLTNEGRKKFLKLYEDRKKTEFKHPILKQKMTYQRCFEQQARFLAKTLQGELDEYPPLLIK